MPNDYIIADGQRLEIGDNVISLTLQISDIADTSGRQTSYTSQLSLPWTETNINALGITTSLNSDEDLMYKAVNAAVYAGGIPVESQGTLRVIGVDKSINAVVNGPEFQFFKSLEAKSLHDLSNISDIDHPWSLAEIAASQAYTHVEGYKYLIIDYGAFPPSAPSLVDGRYMYPAVSLKWLIDQISADTGYTFSCPVFDEEVYQKAFLPFSEGKYEHSQRYKDERSFELFVSERNTYEAAYASSTTGNIISRLLFGGQIYYTAAVGITMPEVTTNITVSRISTDNTNTVTLSLAIIKNTSDVLQTVALGNGINTITLSSVALVAGDTLSVAIMADVTVIQSPALVSIEVESGSFFTPPIDPGINFGDDITGESFTPDWSQKDLLVSFMNHFGLIPKVNRFEKTVEFFPFQNIEENKTKAVDWSPKLVRPEGSNPGQWYAGKTGDFGGYGQTNYLKFATDSTLSDQDFGQGVVFSNNEALPLEKTLFTLKWAASESNLLFSPQTFVVRIDRWSGDYDADELEENTDAKQRLVFYQDESLGLSVTDGTTNTSLGGSQSVAKFVDPSIPHSLAFSAYVQAKYYSILSEILDKPQKLEARLNLSAADITQLDFFIPVYIDKYAAFYYVNKVRNFISGRITTVELIRI